jgi:hypothetical protein
MYGGRGSPTLAEKDPRRPPRISPRKHVSGITQLYGAGVFPVLDVSEWEVDTYEPSGRGEHPWLVNHEGTAWLFKPCTVRVDRREGEDWAEKIAGELAASIGLPAATIEMAVRQSLPGCISRDVKPAAGWEMQEGGVALNMPDFARRSRTHVGHNIANIASVLRMSAFHPIVSCRNG